MAARKTKTHRPKIALIAIFLLLGVFLVVLYQKMASPNPDATLNPVTLPFLNQAAPVRSEVHSSDGVWTLIMQTEKGKDQTKTYSFFVAPITAPASGEQTERLLLTKTISAAGSMRTPLNSWSPDNKLVFLQENRPASSTGGPGGTNFLVLKTSGEAFADGQQYLDVGAKFTQSKIKYILDNATGWASPTLLIITTRNEAAKGPSFWFDIPSHSFLQLGS